MLMLYLLTGSSQKTKNFLFNEWFKIQEKYIKELEMVFYDIAKFKVKWYDSEITGREALERIVEDVLKDDNILMVMKKKSNELYEKNSKGYILKLLFPMRIKRKLLYMKMVKI